jgi:hypothetical protein
MPPSALVHRLQALEREHERDAWRKLEARIPARFKSKPRRRAGANAIAQGRCIADILRDCIACVKDIRSCEGSSAAVPARGAAGGHFSSMASHALGDRQGAVVASTVRDGLLNAVGLFCVEVQMMEPLHRLASRNWMIRRVGKGAGKFLSVDGGASHRSVCP